MVAQTSRAATLHDMPERVSQIISWITIPPRYRTLPFFKDKPLVEPLLSTQTIFPTDLDSQNRALYLDVLKKTLTASVYDESAGYVIGPEDSAKTWTKGNPLQSARVLIKNWIIRTCRERGIQLVRQKPLLTAEREEGKDWPMIGYTMVGHRRLENVQACIEEVLRKEVPGDLIETGVWRGGTTIFMRAVLKTYGVTNRTVWVADSFEGLPPPKSVDEGPDLSGVDFLKVTLENVKSNFERFGLADEQVKFLKGWFADTLPTAPIQNLAILRLDGDLYHSTMDSLVNLYFKVSKGGFVIVDDYYRWPECKQAVTDFITKNGLKPEIKAIDWTGAYWKV